MSLNNIILTGFMGSGKSTIGRRLAKELNTYFLDTDVLIETFENMKISDIFSKFGEEKFRKMEKRCFEWIKKDVRNTVISVGGGLPVFIPEIKEAGIVIYLKVSFEDILKRMNKEEIKKRPLFQDIEKARELFEKRDKIYEKLADYVIKNYDINTTLNLIKYSLENIQKNKRDKREHFINKGIIRVAAHRNYYINTNNDVERAINIITNTFKNKFGKRQKNGKFISGRRFFVKTTTRREEKNKDKKLPVLENRIENLKKSTKMKRY